MTRGLLAATVLWAVSSAPLAAQEPAGYGPLPAQGCPGHGQFRDDDFMILGALPGCQQSGTASVFNHLIRGGAPTPEGLRCLRDLGVTMIVDLRGAGEGTQRQEQRIAADLGIVYLNEPMNTDGGTKQCGNVSAASVAQNKESVRVAAQAITEHLNGSPNARVYVHCAHGQDRTGLMLGVYRLLNDRCSKDLVSDEMRRYYYTPYCALSEAWREY